MMNMILGFSICQEEMGKIVASKYLIKINSERLFAQSYVVLHVFGLDIKFVIDLNLLKCISDGKIIR